MRPTDQDECADIRDDRSAYHGGNCTPPRGRCVRLGKRKAPQGGESDVPCCCWLRISWVTLRLSINLWDDPASSPLLSPWAHQTTVATARRPAALIWRSSRTSSRTGPFSHDSSLRRRRTRSSTFGWPSRSSGTEPHSQAQMANTTARSRSCRHVHRPSRVKTSTPGPISTEGETETEQRVPCCPT